MYGLFSKFGANSLNAKHYWKVAAGLVLATVLTAVLGGWASRQAPEFYQALIKPSWAPSPQVFAPVWTVLYFMMALAACLIIKAKAPQAARLELSLYALQLVLNALWSWLFFQWHLGAAAFIEVVALSAVVMLTTYVFWRVRPWAGLLLLPYLAWLLFASALTFSVWQLNPALL